MVRTFGSYYVGVILRPRRTFDALMADPRRLSYGLWALLTNMVLYTLVYVFLVRGGGAPSPSSLPLLLAIPRSEYYSVNRFIAAPSMFACVVLATGVALLLSRAFSGTGTFEDTFSVFGFGTAIACLASLAHDLPDSFLGAIGVLDLRWYEVALNSPTIWRTILLTLYGLSVLWFFVLYVKGVAASQRLRTPAAPFVGVVAYIVYQGAFLIFNR